MRTFRNLLATTALLTSLPAFAAGTPTVQIATSGGWTAFTGTISEGQPACGVSNWTKATDSRMFLIKWFYGEDHLTLQFSKREWRIPPNASTDVRITFDNAVPFFGTALAHPSGSMLEVPLPIVSIDAFLEEFRESNRMTISFISGNEVPWWADMSGSRPVGVAFERCVKFYLDYIKEHQPTQPYTSQAPTTQPYALPPAHAVPTQPYSSQTQPVPTLPTPTTPTLPLRSVPDNRV